MLVFVRGVSSYEGPQCTLLRWAPAHASYALAALSIFTPLVFHPLLLCKILVHWLMINSW